ncbi:alkylglycerol monooxygenase-like isoform X2 [Coccinella septempunctata]|nr:alkylglycerol monooxygenase-like isoform X2 [Coccinella septempunctata]
MFIILENIVLWLQKRPTIRFNDGISSLSHGLAHECSKIVFRAVESYCYISIYNRFRLVDLSWDNRMTWYLAALSMDFFYYWGHRASHEVHILWAQHQVHHSSEDFNTTVGLRQSVLQGFSFIFYLPMALVIPPSLFITHQHFNLLYQFWVHTEAVETLGPLEYIFNTPQHHRVHHGSNIWCLDTNYGGVLIIWDRIFGTFASDKKDEQIIYGLVVNRPFFDPLKKQTLYTNFVIRKFKDMDNWKLKLCALFFGPSWLPGGPRLGLEKEKFKVVPREKYDVKIPQWCNLYILVHFCVILYGYHKIMSLYQELSALFILVSVILIFTTLTSIGMLFDNHPYACSLEVVRCLSLVLAIQKVQFLTFDENFLLFMEVLFSLSGVFWFLKTVNVLQLVPYEKQEKVA